MASPVAVKTAAGAARSAHGMVLASFEREVLFDKPELCLLMLLNMALACQTLPLIPARTLHDASDTNHTYATMAVPGMCIKTSWVW